MIRFREGREKGGEGGRGGVEGPSATGRSRDRPVATEFRIKWVSCFAQRAPLNNPIHFERTGVGKSLDMPMNGCSFAFLAPLYDNYNVLAH